MILEDVTKMSVKEKVDYFKSIVTDMDKLADVLNVKVGYQNGTPAVHYNKTFFTIFSEHPHYQLVIDSILNMAYEQWFKNSNHTEESYLHILVNIFKKGFNKIK